MDFLKAASQPRWLRLAFALSVPGSVCSVIVYVLSYTAVPLPEGVMALHGGIFLCFLPPVCAVRRWASRSGYSTRPGMREQWRMQRALLGLLPTWLSVLTTAVFVGALASFLIGFAAVAEAGGGAGLHGLHYRLFSGHWIAFYLFSAIYAWRFLQPDLREVN